jgi:hypothetical protein
MVSAAKTRYFGVVVVLTSPTLLLTMSRLSTWNGRLGSWAWSAASSVPRVASFAAPAFAGVWM